MKRWLAAMAGLMVLGSTGTAWAGAVTLFSEPYFRGDRITIHDDIKSLDQLPPWNDRARSLIVHSGTWEVCKNKRYEYCRTLAAGARVADVAEVKNLRGGITSLRQIGRRDDWDDDPRDDRDWRELPPPPPVLLPAPPPRRSDDGIIWEGGGGGQVAQEPQNRCQMQVERAFVQRYGYRGHSAFSGDGVEGTIFWEGEPWHYRCAGGQTNIWR